MATEPPSNGSTAPRWLQSLLTMLLVPALTAVVVVTGMAARFGERLDTLERAADGRWATLNQKLGAEDEQQRRQGLTLERQDVRLEGLDERFTVRGREIALQGQDLSRMIGELRADLHHALERVARLEASGGQARGRN